MNRVFAGRDLLVGYINVVPCRAPSNRGAVVDGKAESRWGNSVAPDVVSLNQDGRGSGRAIRWAGDRDVGCDSGLRSKSSGKHCENGEKKTTGGGGILDELHARLLREVFLNALRVAEAVGAMGSSETCPARASSRRGLEEDLLPELAGMQCHSSVCP